MQDEDASPLFGFRQSEALRETFLAYITNPEDRAAVRRAADLMHAFTVASHDFPADGEPVIVRELRGAAQDLWYLDAFFREAPSAHEGAERQDVPKREWTLAVRAPRWAKRLAKIAAEIEEVLGEVDSGEGRTAPLLDPPSRVT